MFLCFSYAVYALLLNLCIRCVKENACLSCVVIFLVSQHSCANLKRTLGKIMQVRRGADRAEIYSLAFSATAQWLAVSSDKGTIHVFSLKVNPGNVEIERSNSLDRNPSVVAPSSSLSFIKGRIVPVVSHTACSLDNISADLH